ncbi:MAG: hypothetical protein KAG61_04230 [Bacteriovoracaceae bacterium]|nr:hypothetical protein [Bacteriovoracaceae bacterium]
MKNLIVTFKGNKYEVAPLSTTEEIIKKHDLDVIDPIAVVINGHFTRLNKKIRADSDIDIVTLQTPEGKQVYESSVMYLFLVAFAKKFPKHEVFIQHTIQKGIYAEVSGGELTTAQVGELKQYMKELASKNIPIVKTEKDWDEALEAMLEGDRNDMLNLYRYHRPSTLKFYELEGVDECLYMPLAPSTGYLELFEIQKYRGGVIIVLPNFKEEKVIPEFVDRPKLFKSYEEYHKWSQILKVRTVGQLNKYIMNDEIDDLIKIAEAFQEKRVVQIADAITGKEKIPRLVSIAGPTSSGKTTFSKRLGVQLMVSGFKPVTIAMDNYFVDRDDTPVDEDGNLDFEDINAIDTKLFCQHINDLLSGKEIELPKFNFIEGKKFPSGEFMKLEDNQIIVFEGIHGLNPILTKGIDDSEKFRIYIAPLTQLNLHRHDRITAADTRLLRRMVRDNFFRGYSASDTLSRWASVRRGEKKNIFPMQEHADEIFNSALFYELSVLKGHAERALLKVEKDDPVFAEAQRLLRFLSFFLPLHTNEIPTNSILKEFVGGSTFKY